MTQRQLLDATIECLAEKGYARTTTTEISTRAGLSRGAQLHHFPTKAKLVTTAIEYLSEQRINALRDMLHTRSRSDRVSVGIDLLWSSFSGPLFYAAVELWMAARTDSELRDALYPVERRVGRTIVALCEDIFGELARSPRFKAALHLTIYMMRGMALERILKDDERGRSEMLAFWKDLLREALQANGSARPPAKAANTSVSERKAIANHEHRDNHEHRA